MSIFWLDLDIDRKVCEKAINTYWKDNILILKKHWYFLLSIVWFFILFLFVLNFSVIEIIKNLNIIWYLFLWINLLFVIITIFTLSYSYNIFKSLLKEVPISEITNFHLKVSFPISIFYWIGTIILSIFFIFFSLKLFFFSITLLFISFIIFNKLIIFENDFCIFTKDKIIMLNYEWLFRWIKKTIILPSEIKEVYYFWWFFSKLFDLSPIRIITDNKMYTIPYITNRKDVIKRIRKIMWIPSIEKAN